MVIPLEVRNDRNQPGSGIAELVVPRAAGRAAGILRLVIMQADEEEPFLGPAGWQAGSFVWRSGHAQAGDGDLLVPIGPLVTALIEDYTPLLVRLPDLDLEGQLMWSGITPPPSMKAGRPDPGADAASSFPGGAPPPVMARPVPAAPPPPPAEPPAAMEPPPVAEPAPAPVAEPAISGKPVADTPPDSTPDTPPDDPPDDPPLSDPPDPVPPPGDGPRRRGLLWGVAALLLVAFLGGAYWLGGGGGGADDSDRTADIVPPPPPGLADRYEMAVAAAQAGRFDEASTLFHALEREGHGPSLRYLAEAKDSLDFTPGLFEAPNDLDALLLYERACVARETEVPAILDRLEAALLERVEQGDVVARQILHLRMPAVRQSCE